MNGKSETTLNCSIFCWKTVNYFQKEICLVSTFLPLRKLYIFPMARSGNRLIDYFLFRFSLCLLLSSWILCIKQQHRLWRFQPGLLWRYHANDIMPLFIHWKVVDGKRLVMHINWLHWFGAVVSCSCHRLPFSVVWFRPVKVSEWIFQFKNRKNRFSSLCQFMSIFFLNGNDIKFKSLLTYTHTHT